MSPARFIIALVFFHLSGTSITFSQRFLTTFGRVAELRAGRDARGIFPGDFNGDGFVDLASFGGMQVVVNYRISRSSSWQAVPLEVHGTIIEAIPVRCNRDRYDDLVVLTDHPPTLQVFLGKTRERFYPAWNTGLQGSFESLAAGDVNSDGQVDLMVFGKKELGVVVFIGRGNGTFRKDTTLFPEFPVSALSVTDINGDGMNDMVVSNWISNDLLVYSAFGKMKFSEPSVLHFSSEPTSFTAAYLDSDATVDLVVAPADDKSFQIFSGDGLGGFRPEQTFSVPYQISQIAAEDINGDGRSDVCVFSRKNETIGVFLNEGNGIGGPGILFAAGKATSRFCFRKEDGRTLSNLIILDSAASKIRMFQNANMRTSADAEMAYATGLSPGDIVVADCNRDGWNDIIVADNGSPDISLYLNDEQGVLNGQIQLNAPAPMHGLKSFVRDDSTMLLIGTDPEGRLISIMQLNTNNLSRRSFSLSTQGPAQILSIRLDSVSGHLEIVALEHEVESRRTTLVAFEQIAPARFIERDITPKLQTRLLAAVIDDINSDGNSDLVYISYDAKHQQEQLFRSYGAGANRFDPPQTILSFDSSAQTDALLWSGDLDNDGTKDALINFQGSDPFLIAAFGTRDSLPSHAPFRFGSPVRVASPANLTILDLNGDGVNDLVCLNDLKKSVEFYQGKGDGTFLAPVRLASAEALSGFAIGDINHDIVPELIMTDSTNGVLKIISLREE